jgi:FKBP-type peptidyl-prolyl cis-trans isomerase FklB
MRGKPCLEDNVSLVKYLLILTFPLLALSACQQPSEPETTAAAAPEPTLESDEQKASYGLGYSVIGNVRAQFGDGIEIDAFRAGMSDALDDLPQKVTPEEMQRAIAVMGEKQQQAAQAAAATALEAGETFLAENGQRDGVVTLESGLQYEVLQAAEGDKPGPTDMVTTHYEGRLIDGTVFDSSVARGEPATFPLNRVIPGWTEGLQLMSVGSKWRLYVPAELGYGDRGAGQIPPNSTLVFDVELLEIQPAT